MLVSELLSEVTLVLRELDAAFNIRTLVDMEEENSPSSCLTTSIDSVGSGIIGPLPCCIVRVPLFWSVSFTDPTYKLPEVTYISLHLLEGLPKSYKLSVCGIMF